MADTFNRQTRSRIMKAVRSSNNRSTERRFRAIIVQNGIEGWHLNDENLPGRPDFAFSGQHVAVFVDGCFWHGCPACYRRPTSRTDYWDKKVMLNHARDKDVERRLTSRGWLVMRFWEHEVKKTPQHCLQVLSRALRRTVTCISTRNG